MASQPFMYRESVQAYFESAEVRFAVDQLLAKKMSYVPQAFRPEEIADFYRASLAARQTQIDFAQDMYDLWHCIWPELGAEWQSVPYDPADEELSLDPQVRWEERYFQRNFIRPGTGIMVAIWLFLSPTPPSGSEIVLGCLLRTGNRSLFNKVNVPDGWSWNKDSQFLEFSSEMVHDRNGIDLAPLRMAARLVVNLVNELTDR
jgi:hypothetical protein